MNTVKTTKVYGYSMLDCSSLEDMYRVQKERNKLGTKKSNSN